MLRYAFTQHWDRPALWKSGGTRAYGEVWTSASPLLKSLAARLGVDQAVGILAQRSIAAYEGILGCVLAGRPYVPLNMKVPLERQLVMAKTARCGTFISDAKSKARHQQLSAELAQTDWCGQEGETGDSEVEQSEIGLKTIKDDQLAYVMFTSGTTGMPKGVAVTRANLPRTFKQ